ncbi:hypothetical protein [Amycolatopsis sp. NPDC051061]
MFARYEGEATMAFTNTLLPGLFAAWAEVAALRALVWAIEGATS